MKLKHALYGLKRAPGIWHKTWTDGVASRGYRRLKSEECIVIRSDHRGIVVTLIYVHDIVFVGWENSLVQDAKKELMGLFQMRNIGRVSKFHGILFEHQIDGTLASQRT